MKSRPPSCHSAPSVQHHTALCPSASLRGMPPPLSISFSTPALHTHTCTHVCTYVHRHSCGQSYRHAHRQTCTQTEVPAQREICPPTHRYILAQRRHRETDRQTQDKERETEAYTQKDTRKRETHRKTQKDAHTQTHRDTRGCICTK